MVIGEDAVNELVGRFVADLGATVASANVVVGDPLGLLPVRPAGRRRLHR